MSFPSLEAKLGLAWQGDYDSAQVYFLNDVVTYVGVFYVCQVSSTRQDPTTRDWVLYRDSTLVDNALGAVPSTFTFSSDAATTTEAGTVIVPTTGHLAVDGSGNITVNETDVPLLASNNTFAGDTSFDGTITVGKALYPATVFPTYAATVSLNPADGNVFVITALHATGDACTANLSVPPIAGEELSVIVSSNHADPEITFGTYFKASATVKPGANKTIVVKFLANGTDAIEVSRSAAV